MSPLNYSLTDVVIINAMISDIETHLLPQLKKIVPVLTGRLKRSIGVRRYDGYYKKVADDSNFYLVQKIELTLRVNRRPFVYTVVVGSVREKSRHGRDYPARYGHIRYTLDKSFRRRWDRVMKRYEQTFADRVEYQLGKRLGFID